MPDLSRKRERERFAVRHTRYFQRIGRGAFLGFRRGPDTWSARFRGRDGKQAHKFGDPPADYRGRVSRSCRLADSERAGSAARKRAA